MEKRKILKWSLAILLICCLPGIIIFIGISVDLVKEIVTDLTKDEHTKKIIMECKSAASSHDFETAFEKLEEMKATNKYYEEDDQYRETYDFIFKEEVMYLCANNDKNSYNRLSYLLTSIPVKGKALPQGTEYNNSWHEVTEGIDEHEEYREYAVSFNQKCDYIIDLAISNRNFEIIRYIFPLYKLVPDPLKQPKEIADTDSINKKYVLYRISYSDSDKENARMRINKAIKDGYFPGIKKGL